LSELIEHLDLKNIMMVGHSTGGGEIARYVGRHGTKRVGKVVFISSIVPQLGYSEVNVEGVPPAVWNSFREAMIKDRAQFFIDVPTGPFFGYNRDGAKKSQGLIDSWYQQGMMCSIKAVYECVNTWDIDYTEDLKKLDKPVLILHGDDDQVALIKATGLRTDKVVSNGTLKIYPGGPHALPNVCAEEVNKDLLAFLKA
jgi:non-heme chloroperoxidase